MPKWTNQWGLPLPIALALQVDDYETLQNSLRKKLNAPMFSVTTLINPPQISALYTKYGKTLELDVITRTHVTAGQGIDSQMDRADVPGVTYSHLRFVTGLAHPTVGPVYVSFSPDLVYERKYEDQERGFRLVDLKDTKWMALKLSGGDIKTEWKWQLRCYRYLLQHENTYLCTYDPETKGYDLHRFSPIDITRTTLAARLKDWSKWEAYTKGGIHQGYPPCDWVHIDLGLYKDTKASDDKYTLDFLNTRIALHHLALGKKDNELPQCTEEDRWAKESTWAAIFSDGKTKGRAAPGGKSFHSKAAAEEFIQVARAKAKTPRNMHPVYRPGAQTRCEDWCDVSGVCHQFKTIRETQVPF